MSACEVAMECAEETLKEPKNFDPECAGKKLDREHGLSSDVKKGKFQHDVKELHVDLEALTSGAINWDKAILSLQWMVDHASAALKQHDTKEISQFLAKTCVMHTIHCFHHCRSDKAPGYAHEEEQSLTPPPSGKE